VNLGGATFSVVGFAGVDFVLEAVGLDGAGFEGVDFAAGGFEEDGLGEEGLEETFDDVFSLTGAVFEKKDLDGAEAFGGGGFAADALDGVGVGGVVLEGVAAGFVVAGLVAVFKVLEGVAGGGGGGGGVSTGSWPPLRNAWARSRTLGNMLVVQEAGRIR